MLARCLLLQRVSTCLQKGLNEQILRYTGFLRRISTISTEEFSSIWFDHAAIAAPWFLYHKVLGYRQTHLSAPSVTSKTSEFPMESLTYDGMVDILFDPQTCSLFNPSNDKHIEAEKQGARQYFEEVLMVDERRFFDRTGKESAQGSVGWEVGRSGVIGVEWSIIVDGRILIDLSEKVKHAWVRYETGLDL